MATTLTRIRPSGIDPVAEFTFDSIATSTVVVGNVAISDSGNGNIQVASVAANGQIGTPAAIGGGGVTVYATAADLPLVSVANGAQAYVSSTNRLYLWTGTGWFNIALINTSPTITSGPDVSYTLAGGGDATVLTLIASDPEGLPIIWSYEVTSGSLTNGGGATATVSQNNNVFTITPSSNNAHVGTFGLTFTASDGVNIDTATSSFTLSFAFAGNLAYTLINPNAFSTASGDFFGSAVELNGEYLIAAAQHESTAVASDQGAVYVFNASTGSLIRTINNPSTRSGDAFGRVLVSQGDYLVILANGVFNRQGAAYVYSLSSGSLLLTIPSATNVNFQDFGAAALDGNTLVLGVPGYDAGNQSRQHGRVYVYNITTGNIIRTIDNPETANVGGARSFGSSVALSGNTVVIGAPTNGPGVFQYNISNGSLIRKIANFLSPTGENNLLGSSVKILGNNLLISAYGATINGTFLAGRIHLYNLDNGTRIYSVDNPNFNTVSRDDYFGFSVGISNNYILASAYQEDDDIGNNVGVCYLLHTANGSLYKTLRSPNANTASPNDEFGLRVAINDSYAAIPAYAEDVGATNSGVVYVYK